MTHSSKGRRGGGRGRKYCDESLKKERTRKLSQLPEYRDSSEVKTDSDRSCLNVYNPKIDCFDVVGDKEV